MKFDLEQRAEQYKTLFPEFWDKFPGWNNMIHGRAKNFAEQVLVDAISTNDKDTYVNAAIDLNACHISEVSKGIHDAKSMIRNFAEFAVEKGKEAPLVMTLLNDELNKYKAADNHQPGALDRARDGVDRDTSKLGR